MQNPNLYHATFLWALSSIQKRGLLPSSKSNYGGGYGGHTKGRIFLTSWKGLSYWMNKMELIANHETDHPEEGWVPVALRTPLAELNLEKDELGSRDALEDSFYIGDPIPPDRLEVWTGGSWQPVRSVDVEELIQDALEAADFVSEEREDEESEDEDEDEEKSGYYEMDWGVYYPTKKAGLSVDVHDPWHNIREACKQALLLEDHLFHPRKYCEDCVSKHLLTMEAFLEEAITLDVAGGLQKLLESLLTRVLTYQVLWASGRANECQLAQALRKWRKGICQQVLRPREKRQASSVEVIRPEGWEASNDVPDTWTRRGFVYRGMTETEFKATAGKRAPISSTGAWSAPGEGTNFAESAADAESYANSGRTDPRRTGKPTYLVEVLWTPEMKRGTDGYIKSQEPVPFSKVARIWKMYAAEGPTGETTIRGLSGQVVAKIIHHGSPTE